MVGSMLRSTSERKRERAERSQLDASHFAPPPSRRLLDSSFLLTIRVRVASRNEHTPIRKKSSDRVVEPIDTTGSSGSPSFPRGSERIEVPRLVESLIGLRSSNGPWKHRRVEERGKEEKKKIEGREERTRSQFHRFRTRRETRRGKKERQNSQDSFP